MSSIINFNGEVDDLGTAKGTTADQREATYQYKNFSENLKQYVLQDLQNYEEIIVLVRELKY